VQRTDNHPDLWFGQGVAEYLEGVTPDAILEFVAEVRRLREENDSLMSALADCREAAFVQEIDNPYLASAVGDPLEVPGFVAYAVEWLTGMAEIAKGNPAKEAK
jgi:hypothetical protein